MDEANKYPKLDLEDGDHPSLSQLSDSASRPVSALARGVQITEFAESRVNPTPLLLEESDILLEQYLSPGKLVSFYFLKGFLVKRAHKYVKSRMNSLIFQGY